MSENRTSVQASHQRPLEAMDFAGLWVKRLSLAAGGLAAAGLAPGDAKAAIQYRVAPPEASVSVGVESSWGWDIDGNGFNDFFLYGGSLAGFANASGASANQVVGPVNPPGVFKVPVRLNAGNVVGVAPPAGPGGPNQWISATWSFFNSNVPGLQAVGPNAVQGGLNYFGFRFAALNPGDYYYGWGELNVNTNNKALTLTRWAYNDVANATINVGDEGTPVPGPIGLAGLAAGAAWSRKLRRRIREAG